MCLSCTIEEVTGLDLSTDEGHDALKQLGRIPWPTATARMMECAAYIAALYVNEAGGTGGPLHVILDDYNVTDDNLAFGREWMKDWTPYDATPKEGERALLLSGWILDLLELLTEQERSVTIALAHNDLSAIHGHVFMPASEFPIREEILDEDGNKIGWQWGFRKRRVDAQ